MTEAGLTAFTLSTHYGWIIGLLFFLLFVFGIIIYRKMLTFTEHHEEIHKHTVEHHYSNRFPHADPPRLITRFEVLELLQRIVALVEIKGCVATCPALLQIIKQTESLIEIREDFLNTILEVQKETKKDTEKISLRVEGFINDWGTGLMSLLQRVYTMRQGALDTVERAADDKDARQRRSTKRPK